MEDRYTITLSRLTNIYSILYNNYKNVTANSVSIEDVLLVILLSGGNLEIDFKNVTTNMLSKLSELIRSLKETTNIIYTDRVSKNALGILGALKDITLIPKIGSSIEASVLVDNDYLLVPVKYKSRVGEPDFILDKDYPILQKLMSLDTNDIVDIIFSIYSYNIGVSKEKVRNFDDFNNIVQTSEEYYIRSGNTEGFILLLSNTMAFVATDYKPVDREEINNDEQKFYLVCKGNNKISNQVRLITDPKPILSMYMNMS